MGKIKENVTKLLPFIIIFIFLGGNLGFMIWKHSTAEHYVLKNLTYDRVEPSKEWRSHVNTVFVTPEGERVTYICPEDVYRTMTYGKRYDVSIIEGDFVYPRVKIEKVETSKQG